MEDVNKKDVIKHFNNYAEGGKWDSLYDPCNASSYSFIQRKNKVLSLLKKHGFEGKKILDMGCGSGVIVKETVELGGVFYGIDVSSNMIEALKKEHSSLQQQGSVMAKVGDCTDTGYEDKTFDYVVGMGLIEYFDEPGLVVKEAKRILKDDGKIIFTVPRRDSLDYYAVLLTEPFRNLIKYRSLKAKADIKRHKYSPSQLDDLMKVQGLNRVDCFYYNMKPICYPFTKVFPKLANKAGSFCEYKENWFTRFCATGYIGVYQR